MRELSARSRRRVMIMIGVAAALALILLAGALGRRSGGGIRGRTNEQRLAYLRSLGWEPEVQAQEEKEVLLPVEFPEVLQNYNELQRKAGFDLTPLAGEKIEMYVYRLAWPEPETEVLCSLYVYKGRIVGGDIHSTAFRGFMHPLCPKDSESKNG